MKHIWLVLLLFSGSSWAAPPDTLDPESGGTPGLAEDCDCDDTPGSAARPGSPARSGRAQPGEGAGVLGLELFVMSLCPYGMQAEEALIPLAARLAPQLDLRIHFIADEADRAESAPAPRSSGRSDRPGCAAIRASGDGPFQSVHGQPEIDEGRRQLIARDDYPGQYAAYVLCRGRHGPDSDWEACARAVGIDPAALQRAAAGARGEQLFGENIRRANDLGLHLSPTLLIDGVEYTGALDPLSLARYLCRRLPPQEFCDEIPACGADHDCTPPEGQLALCLDPDTPQARCQYREPVEFGLTVLNTAACPSCSTAAFLRTTAELFPAVRVQTASLDTPPGEELARRYGIEAFPAYIFDERFARSARFPRVRHMVAEIGDAYLLHARISGTTYWRERPARTGSLDVFVPMGAPELEEQILNDWPGSEAAARLHYLLPAGGPVPDEMIRRACLAAHQPRSLAAYAAIRSRDRLTSGDQGWRADARAAGVDLPALEACLASGAGRALVAASRALADSLRLDPQTVSTLAANRTLTRRVQASLISWPHPEGR